MPLPRPKMETSPQIRKSSLGTGNAALGAAGTDVCDGVVEEAATERRVELVVAAELEQGGGAVDVGGLSGGQGSAFEDEGFEEAHEENGGYGVVSDGVLGVVQGGVDAREGFGVARAGALEEWLQLV